MSEENNNKFNIVRTNIIADPFLKGINIDALEKYINETVMEKKNNNDVCKLFDDNAAITIKKERTKNQIDCTYPNNITDIGCLIRFE
jgi:hypothetical protein